MMVFRAFVSALFSIATSLIYLNWEAAAGSAAAVTYLSIVFVNTAALGVNMGAAFVGLNLINSSRRQREAAARKALGM